MYTIAVRNVQSALEQGVQYLASTGIPRESRNGPVLQAPTVVATVYHKPDERVLFWPARDANPFFHFYESLWMLAGRRDVQPLVKYVKRMADFSDDGVTMNAAYGNRWFWNAQVHKIIEQLRKNHNDRRCVLQIWDGQRDLYPYKGKDAACNLTVTFQINYADLLEMVVFCRSNDAIWGAWGANAVHFSMLHEFMARAIGVGMGSYTQVSVNLHGYTKTFLPLVGTFENYPCPYWNEDVKPFPIMRINYYEWLDEVNRFVTDNGRAPKDWKPFTDPFFQEVAMPIVMAHDAYKDGDPELALSIIRLSCNATDWQKACEEWILRRIK